MTYLDELSGLRDRPAPHRLLLDVGLDVSPIEALGLTDPTYRAFSWLDRSGRYVANAATFTLPLIVAGRPVQAMAFSRWPRGRNGAVAA